VHSPFGTELPVFYVPIFVLFRPAQFVGMTAGWEAAWTTFLVMLFKAFALHQPMTHAFVLKGNASREIAHMKAVRAPAIAVTTQYVMTDGRLPDGSNVNIYDSTTGTPRFGPSGMSFYCKATRASTTQSYMRLFDFGGGPWSYNIFAALDVTSAGGHGGGSTGNLEFRHIYGTGNCDVADNICTKLDVPNFFPPGTTMEVFLVINSDGSMAAYSKADGDTQWTLKGYTHLNGVLVTDYLPNSFNDAVSPIVDTDRQYLWIGRDNWGGGQGFDGTFEALSLWTDGISAEAASASQGASDEGTATGDPHLQNILGQRFDLMRPGMSTLINIPRGTSVEYALLVVQANAHRLGQHCSDMYFQELNVTGAWADLAQPGGFRFDARDALDLTPKWMKLGPVGLKIVYGHTDMGTQYLNVFVKNLGRAGFPVGGLLGEDDHTAAEKPEWACQHTLSLTKGDQKVMPASVAKAYS